jgi:hypothetical protein
MEKGKDVFDIEMFGVTNEIKIEYGSYNCNGTLALQMFCKPDEDELGYYAQFGRSMEDPYQSPYGIATVNLPESEMLPVNEQFVDENNLPGIGKWLQENNIAKPTGQMAFSGYCCYQAYRFNAPEEALKKIEATRNEVAQRNSAQQGARPKL